LELWQRALVSVLFGIVDKDGYRQFREVIVIIGKKNGKSLLASAISTYMEFADGEQGPDCICIAPLLQQSSYVFNDILADIHMEPELDSLTKSTRDGWKIPSSLGSISQIAFNEKSTDGMNPHIAVLDEMAAWEGDKGLKQYQVIKSSLGARHQAMMLSITTAGYVDDGVYDDVMQRSTALLTGSSTETRFAPFIYMIDDPSKWDDLNEVKKANPNLGVSITLDVIKEDIAAAKVSLPAKIEFLCKRCNIKQNSSCAWLRTEVIEKCFGPVTIDGVEYSTITPEAIAHSYSVGGIDLSKTGDLTSANIVVEKLNEIYVIAHFWLPSEMLQVATTRDHLPYSKYIEQGFLSLSGTNTIDYHDVEDWFNNLMETYEILPLETGYDKWMATYLIEDMKGNGYHMDDVRQGFNLDPVIKEVEGLIKDGRIHFGDNNLMKIHLLNTAVRHDIKSDRYMIDKINPNKHIDGTAAFLDSMTVRQKWWTDIGEQLENGEE
jgi:phage terminase large subunit-like protein